MDESNRQSECPPRDLGQQQRQHIILQQQLQPPPLPQHEQQQQEFLYIDHVHQQQQYQQQTNQHYHQSHGHSPYPLQPATAATNTNDGNTIQQQQLQLQLHPSATTATTTRRQQMISIEEHESIIKRISNHFESTISRLTNDITKYKSTISSLKETKKKIKRKAQDDIRDVMKQYKGSNSAGSVGKRHKNNTTTTTKNAYAAATTQTKHDIKWYNRYEELKSFKEKHGHCNVDPKQSKDLWQWCQTQRTNYTHLIKGHEATTMTPERLKLLNAIRFEFVRNKTPGNNKRLEFVVHNMNRRYVSFGHGKNNAEFDLTNDVFFCLWFIFFLFYQALKWEERFEQVGIMVVFSILQFFYFL